MSFLITNQVFARTMCCTFFLIHYKTHSMKTLESNSKNTYWKLLVNSNLPKKYSNGHFHF
jgi:hypothetical protein